MTPILSELAPAIVGGAVGMALWVYIRREKASLIRDRAAHPAE